MSEYEKLKKEQQDLRQQMQGLTSCIRDLITMQMHVYTKHFPKEVTNQTSPPAQGSSEAKNTSTKKKKS